MMSESIMGGMDNNGWDNDNFKEMRANMLAGKWNMSCIPNDDVFSSRGITTDIDVSNINVSDSADCANCYYKEARGLRSQRLNWLNHQKILYTPGTFETACKVSNNNIVHLNLNLSNICNFKCRMCSPLYSNSWISDAEYLKSSGAPCRDYNESGTKQIIDIDNFFDNYAAQLHTLSTIWVTGGEPFMDDRLVYFGERLREFRDTSKVNINITTNLSKINTDILDKLTHFGTLGINISADATGELFEYMRSSGTFTWDNFNKTVDNILNWRLQQTSKCSIELAFNGSFQTYNSLNSFGFFEYFNKKLHYEKYHDWIEYRILTSPRWLAAHNMPDDIKLESKRRLLVLLDSLPAMCSNSTSALRQGEFVKNCITSLDTASNPREWDRFIEFTAALDIRRNQYIKNYAPNFYMLLDDQSKTKFDKAYEKFKP